MAKEFRPRKPYSPGEDNTNVVQGERIGRQKPNNYWVPPFDFSDGDRAMWFLNKIGFHLDPWQELCLRDMLGRKDGRNGLWAASEICLLAPRQNGKTAIVEARELVGIFLLGEKLILHTAQVFPSARESYYRLKAIIEKNPVLKDSVYFRSGNDNMSIEIADPNHPNRGARILYMARTKNAGRGFSGDVVVLDEAYALDDDMVAAVQYATSARPNPQVIYASSTGLDESETLLKVRERGLKQDPDLALFEWCADKGCDLDDIEQWYKANPALGIRISLRTVEKERRGQPEKQFGRERLGLWADNEFRAVIPASIWSERCNPQSQIEPPYVVAVDADPDRTHATTAIAGMTPEGKRQIEIDRDGRGLSWCVESIAELYNAVKNPAPMAVCVQAGASAGRLIPELEELGIRVIPFGMRDVTDACGFFYDCVMDGSLVHLGDPSLAAALNGATKIHVGRMATANPDEPEFRAWYWGRRDSTVDITGLCAATYALWGLNMLRAEKAVEKRPWEGKPRGGRLW